MPNPIALRLFDAVLGFLLRQRVRRVRRWSFLVTAPLGFLVGRSLGFDLEQVAAVEIVGPRDGRRTGLALGGGPVGLAVSGRTDVLLRFTTPVRLERPLGDPLELTELAIAVDDPARFAAAVEAARAIAPRPDVRRALLPWFAPIDVAEALG